jgi:RNA polymerase sigma-70 factor, ECF subfamily
MSQPDHEVLRRAQRGDEEAFVLIVRQYERPVFNYVLGCVRNHHLAEDITQEVFFRVFQSLSRFSFRSQFTTWLFSVTKNRVLDELRSIERHPQRIVADTDAPSTLRAAEAPFEQRETMEQVWDAIERLDADLKMALLLRDLVGLTYEEIANSLEITLATVKWRIHIARRTVAGELGAEAAAPAVQAAPGS